MRILLADDESSIRLAVGDMLEEAGYDISTAPDGTSAQKALIQSPFDILLTDIRMPGLSGLELFDFVLESQMPTRVIIMTAYANVNDAVDALKRGAADYLTKPFDTDELQARIARVADHIKVQQKLQNAQHHLSGQNLDALSTMVGKSSAMVKLKERIRAIAPSEAGIVVRGESGTGKELVARALHTLSPRAEGPFVVVNCAALPESLIESELFGHEKGAFTGAYAKRIGRFEAADSGTIFLDEIGEIPLAMQPKLLRVLQEQVFESVGSTKTQAVNVRIVAATHRNLKQMIDEGTFREDLYYRLNILEIRVPPLRERDGDLPLFVQHFLNKYGKKRGLSLSPSSWTILQNYAFPGNIRELEHAIHHGCVLAQNKEIQPQHLPFDISGCDESPVDETKAGETQGEQTLQQHIREEEHKYIKDTLVKAGGKRGVAADRLGISRKNLWEKMRTYGLK